MNILSLDWDYFFPDNFDFDWQMAENNYVFYEIIWSIRWGNMNYKTKQLAKDVYHPDRELYSQFINIVLNYCVDPLLIGITDSHSNISAIFESLNFIKKFSVWNFDQHHDFWYGETEVPEYNCDCGNWVKYYWNKIKEYHLVYPAWRKKFPEPNFKKYSKYFNSIDYSIPHNILPEFDVIFICRSSPWTPSWSDYLWMELLNELESRFPYAWDNARIQNDFAMKERQFNKDEAEQFYQNSLEQLRKMKGA